MRCAYCTLPRLALCASLWLVQLLFSHTTFAANSQCFGTTSRGRIEHSVALPIGGSNFSAYSDLAARLGRTHVHSTVAEIVTAAYVALRESRPDTHYVYGETGWAGGGAFPPHRTHQNGLSVDFFVPVLDASGNSALLPSHVGNRFGYDIEFDAKARYADLRIDFPAIAEHLHQLNVAARARKVRLDRVIFDTTYLPALFATPRGAELAASLTFMRTQPWVRHDEHYHIDFDIACKPMRK